MSQLAARETLPPAGHPRLAFPPGPGPSMPAAFVYRPDRGHVRRNFLSSSGTEKITTRPHSNKFRKISRCLRNVLQNLQTDDKLILPVGFERQEVHMTPAGTIREPAFRAFHRHS